MDEKMTYEKQGQFFKENVWIDPTDGPPFDIDIGPTTDYSIIFNSIAVLGS